MRLLLVEDDLPLGEGLRAGLQAEGYTVDWLHDGASAVHALLSETFDLVVLDLGLPRLSGIEVLQQLRKSGSHLPVLILTARDETRDRIAGLDAGADDYLAKPFDLNELKARIRALLRRSAGRGRALVEHAGINLNPANQQVHYQGNPVALTPKEYLLLHELRPSGQGVHPRAPGATALRLGRRSREQHPGSAHLAPAQEAVQRADQNRARHRLPGGGLR